jgi:hypothetical protein
MSNDISFRLDVSCREASIRKDVQGYLGSLASEPLSKQVAHCRRLLESVTQEPACAPEAVEIIEGAQYGLMVGRHLLETCPSRSDPRRPEPRRSTLEHLGYGIERRPIDFGAEGRLAEAPRAQVAP